MTLDCPYCRAKRFASSAGLSSHVKRCRTLSKTTAQPKTVESHNVPPSVGPRVPMAIQIEVDEPYSTRQSSLESRELFPTDKETQEEFFSSIQFFEDYIHTERSNSGATMAGSFDSTFHLVDFMRSCRAKQGLSTTDMNALLNLLFDSRFNINEVTVRSAYDVDKWEQNLYNSKDVSIWHLKF